MTVIEYRIVRHVITAAKSTKLGKCVSIVLATLAVVILFTALLGSVGAYILAPVVAIFVPANAGWFIGGSLSAAAIGLMKFICGQ